MSSTPDTLADSRSAISTSAEDAGRHCQAGRASIELGQLDDARSHLEACVRIEPDHHRAAFELARLEFRSGQFAKALTYLSQFLAAQNEALPAEERDTCEQIIDHQFRTAPQHVVYGAYLRMAQLGSTRHLTILRAFTLAIERKQWEVAKSLLGSLRPAQNAREHLPLASYYREHGERAKALRHVLDAGESEPGNPNVARDVLEELIQLGELEAAAGFLDRARKHLAPKDVACIELSLAADRPDPLPDLALAAESAMASPARLTAFLDRAGSRLSDDQRERAYAALERRFPANSSLLMALSRIEMRQRRFSQALDLGARALECAATDESRANIRFELFRTACLASQLDRAAKLLADCPLDGLNPKKLISVSEYFAEAGRWSEAFDALERGLQDCQEITPTLFQHIIRTANQARKHQPLLEWLSRWPSELPPDLHRLAVALFEDWAAAEGRVHADALALAQKLKVEITPLLDFKLSVLAPKQLARLRSALPATKQRRRAVFYCADNAYILPAMVSLSSMLSTNRGFHADALYLVVNDALAPSVEPVLKRLSKHFDVRINLQHSSELVPDVASFKTSWGYFTAGKGLSPAAYYRIYMARRLAASGNFDELLYVDSDTVVSHGFQELRALPVADHVLLMAALDLDLPGINEATRRHGLAEGRYFNSGVLWFPRVNEALVDRLRDCERVTVERAQELMFLDQCALNIAFASAFEPLPRRFNFFLRVKDAELYKATPATDVCLLHMLDRPKPWVSCYPDESPIKGLWLDALHELRHACGDSVLRPLVEATFC
jgi:lipopolysaccharide biosynthesis glycosyltransferase/lipopolysaccharide biosynthesis regulator YciM